MTEAYDEVAAAVAESLADEEPLHQAAELAEDPLLILHRMESALIRADLAHPDVMPPDELRRLRYLLGFARLTTFQPGAAGRGQPDGRPEVTVGPEVEAFRTRVLDELALPLRRTDSRRRRLERARPALARLVEPLEDTRRAVLTHHADDFSPAELDAEVGTKVLVNAAGGGGGAGYVYMGAAQRLDEEGILPSYVVGSSIGALMGLFSARTLPVPWEEYVTLAKSLKANEVFSPGKARRRHGLPSLLSLELARAVGHALAHPDGRPLRITELDVPYEAVVAGVRRRSFEKLPARFRRVPTGEAATGRLSRLPGRALGPAVAARMWQVAAFFDPRVVKPIVFGRDQVTAAANAVDAAGFSAAIPGVLQYEAGVGDERMAALLDQVLAEHDVAALVDGGVASNVPVEQAWQGVQSGKLGTRNAFFLAFDCFHPQWDPKHLWLQPITQAVQLQMARNAPFADWIIRFEPTLSPINLVPSDPMLDKAIGWGRAAVEDVLPLIRRSLEPVGWDEAIAR